jgi:two-component system chemotaxis sensor kinase CheA
MSSNNRKKDTAAGERSGGAESSGTQRMALFTSPPDRELLEDYITEVDDYLDRIEETLLSIDRGVESVEAVNDLFRAFHTIKGLSGFLGLEVIQTLSHRLESLFERVRNGELPAQSITESVFHGVDLLRSLLGAVSGGGGDFEATPLQKYFHELEVIRDGKENEPPDPAGVPGVAGEFREGGSGKRKTAAGKDKDDESAETFEGTYEHDNAAGVTQIGDGSVGVFSTSRSNRTEAALGKDASKDTIRKQPPSTKPLDSGSKPSPEKDARGKQSSIKVDVGKLDRLINHIGELVIIHTQIAQNASLQSIDDQKIDRDLARESKIIKNIQEISMSLRMVTMKGIYRKMARLVRDLSRKSGKRIELITHGEDTECDRNVVDLLIDPLIHIIRNSVDHGIETKEERIRAGKHSYGTVELSAVQTGGYLNIDVKDDGRGLDKGKILDRAIQKGLIADPSNCSEKEIYELIMAPGFSTAENVTSISGRGVGMDVVRKAIEKLRGSIEIYSSSNQGTHIHLRLPMSLSIIEGLIAKIGNESYIFPIHDVVELLQSHPDRISKIQNSREVVTVHGEIYPIIRLRDLLSSFHGTGDAPEGILVMVESEGKRICFLVEEIVGQQQVVLKDLGYGIHGRGVFAGGAILGDGKVGIIFDIAGLIRLAGVPDLKTVFAPQSGRSQQDARS